MALESSSSSAPLFRLHRYKLIIAYEGTAYSGWQVQPNGLSIQELVQKAVATPLRRTSIDVTGSGRTDAGVHALGQVAHFSHDEPIDSFRFLRSVNSLLPADIRLLSLEQVPHSFHARYSALGKIYHYHLYTAAILDPFVRSFRAHFCYPVDLPSLRRAASIFVGTHDFKAFANEACRGAASRDSVRTLRRLDIIEEPGGLRFEFEADGFLYQMVRNLTGTLIDFIAGKYREEDLLTILASKDRRQAGRSAPPQGLFLVRVIYGSDVRSAG